MQSFDVVIMGGGLAGQTLALYLRKQMPGVSVAVVEPTVRPLPEACHKVGESSVEIGARFFDTEIGLREYLLEHQLIKNGLRYFTGDTQGPLANRREIGPSEHPVLASYQLDRGKLENDLRQFVTDAGVSLFEGFSTYRLDLADAGSEARHLVHIAAKGKKDVLDCRWVIDASGRHRIIQKKLGLTRDSGHTHSSAWFRIPRRFYVKELVPETDTAWHARDVDDNRWLSTCHLMGKGYWVWLIPLSSGLHSIGIVAGEEHHPLETYGRPDTAMAWIQKHEPVLYEKIKDEPMEDFLILKKFAYTSERVFSREQRWCCVGEAGVFVDPLYSPGSDLISLANVLTTEIVKADLVSKEPMETQLLRDKQSNDFFLGFVEVTTSTFRGHSHINGSPSVLPAKLYWDNLHYWSFVCQYFFNQIYKVAPADHAKFRKLHLQFYELNLKAQSVLKTWAHMEPGSTRGDFVPLPQFPSALADLHLDLQNRRGPDETFEVMSKNFENAKAVVRELVLRALKAVGPERAAVFADKTGFLAWDFLDFAGAEQELRFVYDENKERRNELRRQIHRIPRDMERCLGKAENDGVGPTMRELVALAKARASTTATAHPAE
ncbi:MAG: tryptophan 7-halogenase [Sandaracinaceae bacterium]|nr:tryptophan 7-halogenase [Sandaracinaceae bacterium]